MAYIQPYYVNYILDDNGKVVSYDVEDYSTPMLQWIDYVIACNVYK